MKILEEDEYGFVETDYENGIEVYDDVQYIGVSVGQTDKGKDIFYDGANACWLTPNTDLLGYWDENLEEALEGVHGKQEQIIRKYFFENNNLNDFTDREKDIIASFIEDNADNIYDAPSHYRWVAFSIRWLYLGERERVLNEREK